MRGRLLAIGLGWLALTGATPLPLTPPSPDLTAVLGWVTAPLDKPAVQMDRLLPPPPPHNLPPLPLAPVVEPAAPKPWAPVPSPRAFPPPCAGSWLRIASESFECGRARFGKGEYEEAAPALEHAVRNAIDADLITEARYWYAEALYRLGRSEQADWLFRQVAGERAPSDFTPWAMHGSGWTALRLGDVERARQAFARLLAAPHPVPLDVWGRHGHALALYTLRRHEEAEQVWSEASKRRLPPALERDVLFWRGENLGRIARAGDAALELTRFTHGGGHALLLAGYLRLGWWSREAGQLTESADAFRSYLGMLARGTAGITAATDRDWAEAGLALTLIASGQWQEAANLASGLEARRSPLATPTRLRLIAAAVENAQAAAGHAVVQELLGANLAPAVRAWVLFMKAEAHHAEGNRDEARTQYELARTLDAGSATGRQAALRIAQTDFDMREFTQTISDLAPLLAAPLDAPLRAAVLMLYGESAYRAGDHARAGEAYRRALVEFPTHTEAPTMRLALGWTALRLGQREDALRDFLEFARAHPNDPRAVDALVLASELELAAGRMERARELLDRIVTTHASHPRADFARLNRAILLARSGELEPAERELRDWISRAPFPPLLGRAHGARGVVLLAAGRPADGVKEFELAHREGWGELAGLGLGTVALAQGNLDEAARTFADARDNGPRAAVVAAEYGLAVVAFLRGAKRDFRSPAQAALDAAPRGPLAPGLLYVLAGLAAEEGDWPAALAAAKRLVEDFPTHEAADDALERVGAAAANAKTWAAALEAWILLRQRYPQSPFVETSRVAFGESQLAAGKGDEARRTLEEFVAAAPSDSRAPHAWLLLARAREAAGDKAGALEAFTHAARFGQGVAWTPDARLAHGRLLAGNKRWADARGAVEPVLRQADTGLAGEAAVAIGDAFQGEGDHLAAAEFYLTAAYLAPESVAGRRGLLAAGRSFAALKQPAAAATVYRKLLSQANVPADVAQAAQQALTDLRR